MTEKIIVLKGRQLIDGNGGDVLKDPVVVIEANHIKEIGTEATVQIPENAETVDLSGYTLMPGMMDIHLHCSAYNVLTFKNYRVSHLEHHGY